MVQKSPVYAILCTLEQQRTATDKQEHKLLPVYKIIGIAHKAGGRTILNDKEVINDVLVNLFNEIMELEEQAIITDEYKDITNNDMHIIAAIGLGEKKMSDIAAELNITVGSLTIAMNALVKKGYAQRERSEKDRRVVFIHLTVKGRKAFHHHAEYHRQMTDAVVSALSDNEVGVLAKALEKLSVFFRQYQK